MQSVPIIRKEGRKKKRKPQNIGPIDDKARCPFQILVSDRGSDKEGLWSRENCIPQRKHSTAIVKSN